MRVELASALDFRNNYEKKVAQSVGFLKKKLGSSRFEFGLVLGSGLGALADAIENQKTISYADIPNFLAPTVPGHEGRIVAGELEGTRILCFKGRTHFYEVANEPFNTGIMRVVFPVRVLAGLGVKNFFTTSAVGGLNPKYKASDAMVVRSHINLLPNPLLGSTCFLPMHGAYDEEYRKKLAGAGAQHEGVLACVSGPSFETEAECVAFRDGFKADAVGMTTAPEVIAARALGMRVVGLMCVTNSISRNGTNTATHEEVKAILNSLKTRERFLSIVRNFFKNI